MSRTFADTLASDGDILRSVNFFGRTLVHVLPGGGEETFAGVIDERQLDSLATYEDGAVSKRMAEIYVPNSVAIVYESPASKTPSMIRDGSDVWVVRKPIGKDDTGQTVLAQIVSRTSQKRAT